MILVLEWLKFGAGVALGAYLMIVPACTYGQRIERQAAAVKAGKEALERITKLEMNNARFKSLSPGDRCLEFMRDSGLPERECD